MEDAIAKRLPREATSGGRRPEVVQLDSADSAFLIPVASSVHGAGGTYFRSDFAISNRRSVDQTIGIAWIAQGVNSAQAPLQHFTIRPGVTVALSDFVAATLGKTGIGAVAVFGETSTFDTDSSAALLGFSRIWTNQPNASGTVSLQFPAVSIIDSVGSAAAYAIGLRHDSQYRTNVGIVNLDSVSHTWTITIYSTLHPTATFTVTIPPYSMNQVPLPAATYGDVFLQFQTTGSSFWWSAYAASVDNITGDGWVSRALQPLTGS